MPEQARGGAGDRLPSLRFGKGRAGASGRAALSGRLFVPVDIASLAFFRVAFGLLMFWEISRYFSNGWVGSLYAEPAFRFTYYGFGWVEPLPAQWMYWLFIALEVLALLIAVGYLYRISTALFFAGFTYTFLLDQANYLNHFYLICLLSFLMIFVPAHRAFSIDAWMRPRIRSRTVPAWTLWLLMAQIGIVYFYGGLAKLNGDWLRGEPMRMWLAGRTDFPLIGRFFTEEWMVYLFSYGGLLLDLLVVPFLLWRRTRLAAFLFALLFHITNAELFDIGVFPWLAIAATTLFFPPDWPRTLLRRATRAARREAPEPEAPEPEAPERSSYGRRAIVVALGVYLIVQLLVPLRHHLYPGDVNWTEEGHRFSWRMMLHHKDVRVGFVAEDPRTGETVLAGKSDYGLTEEQIKEMPVRPDMILQFAHHVEREMRRQGRGDMEVRAVNVASLNGREYTPMVDPDVDLADEPRNLAPADWILPNDIPLERRDSAQ